MTARRRNVEAGDEACGNMTGGNRKSHTPDEAVRLARLLVRGAQSGALATNRRAARTDAPAQPYVSKVGLAADGAGRPVFLFSTLAAHTQDILADPRAALLVQAPRRTQNPLEGARCSLIGRVQKVPPDQQAAARALYLSHHPGAVRYVGFGDFALWRMAVDKVHYVGGFGLAKWAKGADYGRDVSALADLQEDVLNSLNGPKINDLRALAKRVAGRRLVRVKAVSIDADGLAIIGAAGRRLRVDFASPAPDVRGWRDRLRRAVKQAVST